MLFSLKKNVAALLVVGSLLSISQSAIAHDPKEAQQESKYAQLKDAAHWGLALGVGAAAFYVAAHHKNLISDPKTAHDRIINYLAPKLVALPKWAEDNKHSLAIATALTTIVRYPLGWFNGFKKGYQYHIIKQTSIPNAWVGVPADEKK